MFHAPPPSPAVGRDSPAEHPLTSALKARAAVFGEPSPSTGPFGADWLSLDRLQEPGAPGLEAMLAAQALSDPEMDQKTRAAFLVHRYSWHLSAALAVPYLGFDLYPDFSSAKVAIPSPGAAAEPLAAARYRIRLLDRHFFTAKAALGAHPDATMLSDREVFRERFRLLLESHFALLLERLHALSGLAAAAMWRLVGDSLAAVFLEAGIVLGCGEQAKEEAMAILKVPGSPLNNSQLHFFEVEIPAADPAEPPLCRSFRARGGCCRFYKTAGGELCSTCVLERPENRKRRLEEWLRESFRTAADS